MRLIDKNSLKERCVTYINGDRYVAEWRIESEPEIDAEPVRRGRWGNYEVYSDGYRCSCCEFVNRARTRYCPSCGARMDEEVKHER